MLVELCIQNLALIERAQLRCGAGLNAITGETGAGKSLLIGALDLLLGERLRGTPADWVRAGAERALVDGRFELPKGALAERVAAWLEEQLPEQAADWAASAADAPGGERELVLGRSLGRDGRSRAHVNGRPVTQKALRALAGLLVEVHGQNESMELLDADEQRRLLDAFGSLEPRVADYRRARAAWRVLEQQLAGRDEARAERLRRVDYLRFQLAELEAARVEPGERARLEQERELLRSAGELRGELARLLDALSEGEGAALDRLRAAERSLERWRARIAQLGEPAESLASACVHVDEAVRALASLSDAVEADPARLEQLEERLDAIERLERKHACAADELAPRLEAVRAELLALEAEEHSSAELESACAQAQERVESLAAVLSTERAKLGPRLVGAVVRALGELGLEKAEFALEWRERGRSAEGERGDPAARLGPEGSDELEFLLAANPGEPRRPLRHVASGGEAARIMLALRTVLSGGAPGRTLVFDEIDSGVGGRLGPKVAKHLRLLGRRHQVLCVTHLPAIAAAADVHLKVSKSTRAGRTSTQLEQLAGEAREREVADMIAGGRDQATARAEARRLLDAQT